MRPLLPLFQHAHWLLPELSTASSCAEAQGPEHTLRRSHGRAQTHTRTRPGVVISYTIAGFAALLSSLCYAEFAADIPVAGGAFNYIGMT